MKTVNDVSGEESLYIDDVEELTPSRVEREQVDDDPDACIKGLAAVFCKPRSAIKSRGRGFSVGRGRGKNVNVIPGYV